MAKPFLEQLRETEERFRQLEASLADSTVTSDAARYTAVMKEYRSLSTIVERYRDYRAAEQAEREALEILEESQEPGLRDLANEELRQSRESLAALEQELTVLLLPHDPNDEKNVLVEIRAGTGGEQSGEENNHPVRELVSHYGGCAAKNQTKR